MSAKPETNKPSMDKLDNLFLLNTSSPLDSQMDFEAALDVALTIPFFAHPFKLYEDERLEDMVESIKKNGVMQPIIVRFIRGRYEILSGHNRVHASKQAAKTTIPAIVMQDLSDEDAWAIVIETNLMQRSFNDMRHSEKAAVIALHHSKMFSQGKRNDVLEQLQIIEKATNDGQKTTSAQFGQKLDSRQSLANAYGLSRNTIARYLRINKLICTLKEKLDDGVIPFIPAVDLSFLKEREQQWLDKCISQNGFAVNLKKAAALRQYSADGKLDEDNIYLILNGDLAAEKKVHRTPSLGKKVYKEFFSAGQSEKEIQEIIYEALLQFYAGKEQDA